ncbi:hypothetical protein KDK95_29450 [Actinospica sp. MGRD01-02]|uniref:REase AHJR-like domain-containing protein n=1 Tax=Actinospica acidithermotolerans TaxID=2828514 RepID=A0A941EHF6_9ACTN|nr:hypothetical protein [Actinospica acidithermotolerans]MBR7830463.1 hypothetical protein [Actinospica acidithermotolerans]
MTSESSTLENELQSVLAQYRADGYEVLREGAPAEIRDFLHGFVPDYVAVKGEEVVLFEVRRAGAGSKQGDAALKELTSLIPRHKNWRIELVWLGRERPRVLARDKARQVLADARRVAEVSLPAALLLAFAAAEAAVEYLLAPALGREEAYGLGSVRGRLTEAESLGVISPRHYEALSEASDLRNQVAHVQVTDVPRAVVDSLFETVELLTGEGYASLDAMIDWFRGEFENPAEHVPYDSRDGGYQYINGSYEPEDVLTDQFPGADPLDRAEAAASLAAEAFEWVRKGDY